MESPFFSPNTLEKNCSQPTMNNVVLSWKRNAHQNNLKSNILTCHHLTITSICWQPRMSNLMFNSNVVYLLVEKPETHWNDILTCLCHVNTSLWTCYNSIFYHITSPSCWYKHVPYHCNLLTIRLIFLLFMRAWKKHMNLVECKS